MSAPDPDGSDPPDASQIFEQFEDVFADLFGMATFSGPVGPPSPDLRMPLRVTFAEAAEGSQRDVTVRRFFGCSECDGGGGAAGARLKPCADCGGAGAGSVVQGAFRIQTACVACHGRGGSWDRPCARCDGAGGGVELETLSVTIPGGVTAGQTLRLVGKGNVPKGTDAGDLYLAIVVGPDPRLERDGADLIARVTIDDAIARDGGVAKVPVPRGAIDVDVRPGTKSGDTLRLRGYGAVKLGSPSVPLPSSAEPPYRSVDAADHRGDLVVTFLVKGQPLPDALRSPEERELERSDRRFVYAAAVATVLLGAAYLLSSLH